MSEEPPVAENAPSSAEDGDNIRVNIRMLDDRETTAVIGIHQTVADLVELGRNQLNVTTGLHRIIFQGRVLNPEQAIHATGLQNEQTVHLLDRGPTSSANERPNVERASRFPQLPTPTQFMIHRAFERASSPPVLQNVTILNSIRVPPAINGSPVYTSRISEEIVHQECRMMRIVGPRPPAPVGAPLFTYDPHSIAWTFRIIDDIMFRPRENLEVVLRDVINEIPFLDENIKSAISFRWDSQFSQIRVDLPQIAPHIASPALEKLDFLCLWTENLTKFNEKLAEPDGLLDAVRQVLEMTKRGEHEDGLTEQQKVQRVHRLDAIIRELEMQSTEITFMKDFEHDRFSKNQSDAYRRLKLQEYVETPRNPRFIMRHALDTDLVPIQRQFRRERQKFAEFEELLDELNEHGAMKFIRDSMTASVDYRYQALSMFYNYVQRMRHQISHITHLTADFDVSFMTPSNPQRLLPAYAINVLTVPQPHAGSLIFKFSHARTDDPVLDEPVTTVVEPPRARSDVARRAHGDWPYLPFFPPSVHLEAVLTPPRRVVDPRIPVPTAPRAPRAPGTDLEGLILNMIQGEEDPELFRNLPPPGPPPRRQQRRLPLQTAGDAPSIAVETQPPPEPPNSRYTTRRFNVQPDARGPETSTLSALPLLVEPTELQRIARNIASRYRNDALQRIANNLNERFQQESWETRIQNMPLCTLRQCVAIALELLTSAGNSVAESRELMLALVRDEEVLVRAIAECVKSLFGRGEFPTHVARLIMPRNEMASARHDYESVDSVDDAHSDEFDGMMVRVPSDISQPSSGDLRADRQRRQNRRLMLFNRARLTPSSSSSNVASTSGTSGPGPSFNAEDAADIRAGRLPLAARSTRRQPRGTSPSQIQLTFSANAYAQVVPSTSAADQPAPIPVRQVVSPTPTTRAQFEYDPNEPSALRSTPSPPAPTPRSAPATETSSPIRAEAMETDEEPPPTAAVLAARYAARQARARIDHLAASFTGNLADTRRQAPFREGAESSPDDAPRETRRRTPPGGSSSNHVRPMVSIDPFMHCTNRNCEVNRLQSPVALADGERFSMASIQPDPEYIDHTYGMGPPVERRPAQISPEDEDYNYTIGKNSAGDLSFNDMEIFKKFVRTMVRSVVVQCIDADSLITMNMNPISGYPAANHNELVEVVRKHVQVTTRNNRWQHAGPWNQSPGFLQSQQIIDDMEREAVMLNRMYTRRNQAGSRSSDRWQQQDEFERTREFIANSLTFLVDYMASSENPRPPGLFGLLLEASYNRLNRTHFAHLAREHTAYDVVERFEREIRAHIRANYLGGRDGMNALEIHPFAENLANTEEFFGRFMRQNPQMPTTFSVLDGETTVEMQTTWAFRQVEIAMIKTILSCAQLKLEPMTAVRLLMESAYLYLHRNLLIFWKLSGRDHNRQKLYMKRVSDFFATLRYEGVGVVERRDLNAFIENWNRIIQYWHDKFQEYSEYQFAKFVQEIRQGNGWTDFILPEFMPVVPGINEPCCSIPPSTSSDGNSNSRKRNYESSNSQLGDVTDVPSTSEPSTSDAQLQ